jgi:hypothetical protein
MTPKKVLNDSVNSGAVIINPLNKGLNFVVIQQSLELYGQLFTSPYKRLGVLWNVNINDVSTFVDIEERVTVRDGKESKFFLLLFCNPANKDEVIKLPITGKPSAENFQITDCISEKDFTANGTTYPKGTKRIRVYAV